MKKRLIVLGCIFLSVGLLIGCVKKTTTEVTIFAASSLTETLTQISKNYKKEFPQVTITFQFDSSGTLRRQIEEGAACDLFISAAPKQMEQLDVTERIDILENKVVLAVSNGNSLEITSFLDIPEKCSLIALGNSDVPVGQYSEEILENLGVLKQLEEDGKITYGSNVKEVTTQIEEGSVDCGIIYKTDAFSSGLEIVEEADETICSKVVYPAAILKQSRNQEEAAKFLAYLQTKESMNLFETVGFQRIQ